MSSGRYLFKKSTVVRAIEAVKATGLPVERVEFGKDGGVIVVTSKEGKAAPADALMDWMEKHADQIKGR